MLRSKVRRSGLPPRGFEHWSLATNGLMDRPPVSFIPLILGYQIFRQKQQKGITKSGMESWLPMSNVILRLLPLLQLKTYFRSASKRVFKILKTQA